MTTTTSIPLDAMTTPEDRIRRDRWGRYLVVPPGGGKPAPYTRATTVAKTLDNGEGLIAWKAAMAICGTLQRRGLRAQWETLLAQHQSPWYAGSEPKAECKRLVEECSDAGGANDRRELGTSLHAITALVDQGLTPSHLGEETEADVEAYTKGLKEAGITLAPEVELTVVLDDVRIAGTFDRLARVPGWELPVVLDLKTGADLSYAWQGIAAQLAIYARADNIYRQGAAADGSEDERLPMPAVDQTRGLVAWLPAGEARLELFVVDLTAGWEATEASLWTRDWRKAQVAVPFTDVPPEPEPQPQPKDEREGLIDVDQNAQMEALRGWLAERIRVIGRHHEARVTLQQRWPADLPTLRSSSEHTPAQLDAMDELLSAVERRHELPFPEPRPDDALSLLLQVFPNSTVEPPKEHHP